MHVMQRESFRLYIDTIVIEVNFIIRFLTVKLLKWSNFWPNYILVRGILLKN